MEVLWIMVQGILKDSDQKETAVGNFCVMMKCLGQWSVAGDNYTRKCQGNWSDGIVKGYGINELSRAMG